MAVPSHAAVGDASVEDVLVAELACEATTLWLLGKHDGAAQTLERLQALLPEQLDARVSINMLLASHYCESRHGLPRFVSQLQSWLSEQPAIGARGALAMQSARAVAAINLGAALLAQQQAASALSVLEPVYARVEALHGGAALVLCCLLLEIHLDSGCLGSAAAILDYLDIRTGGAAPPASRQQLQLQRLRLPQPGSSSLVRPASHSSSSSSSSLVLLAASSSSLILLAVNSSNRTGADSSPLLQGVGMAAAPAAPLGDIPHPQDSSSSSTALGSHQHHHCQCCATHCHACRAARRH
jgi:hypothetical protein